MYVTGWMKQDITVPFFGAYIPPPVMIIIVLHLQLSENQQPTAHELPNKPKLRITERM